MGSMDFLFSGFGLTVYSIIAVYYYTAKREQDSSFKESRIWIYGGIGYVLMLLNDGLGVVDMYKVFYLFLLTTLFLSMHILNSNIRHVRIIPPRFYLSVMAFIGLWMGYGILQGFKYQNIVIPAILLQTACFSLSG